LSPEGVLLRFAKRSRISAFFVERFTISLHQIARQAGREGFLVGVFLRKRMVLEHWPASVNRPANRQRQTRPPFGPPVFIGSAIAENPV
jgi:hypothetical protein